MTRSSKPRPRMLVAPALVLSTVLLSACAVGPDYRQPPPVDTGSGWTQAPDAVATSVDYTAWWATLGDPELVRLVDAALTDNLDLRIAQARISETRALRDRVAGGYAPAVGTSGTVTRRRQSENGPLPIGSIPGMQRDQTIYDAGFDAAWEIDLFGRTGRAVESADAGLQAAQADANGVRMSVAAEVARSYFSLRGAQRELVARDASLAALQQTLDLIGKRFEAGDIALTELLSEDRILRDVENAYVRTHTTAAIDLVALFKALGGGWDPQPSDSEDPQ